MSWTVLLAAAALAWVNAVTFLRFWQDKQRARTGDRRIPEADLLGLAIMGGSAGALLARLMFRHKTRKQPFSDRLIMIASLQAVIVVGLGLGFAL